MPDSSAVKPSSEIVSSNPVRCPICGGANADWAQFCVQCGKALPPEAAARAEIGHLAYVHLQFSGWRARNLISEASEAILRAEVADRERALLIRLNVTNSAATPTTSQASVLPPSAPEAVSSNRAASPSPTLPPLPPMPFPAPPQGAYEAGQPGAANQNANGSSLNGTQSASPKAGGGLREFFQEHALKAIFALAAILVLVAMKSILAWDWVGAYLIGLVPCVPMGLTLLFWAFGQRTRQENPWAAFVYHALATILVGCDVLAVNKYWLLGALPLHTVMLGASLAATALAVWLLQRWREIPYLHLFQSSALITLITIEQAFSPKLFGLSSVESLAVGGVYLAYAALCFGAAYRMRKITGSLMGAASTVAASEPTGAAWASALQLWGHLVVVVGIFEAFLETQGGTGQFAGLLVVAGTLYAVAAQALNAPRMAYASSGFIAGGAAIALQNSSAAVLWHGAGFVLLAWSATALALSAYNARPIQTADSSGRLDNSDGSARMTQAWLQVATIALFLATVEVGAYALNYSDSGWWNRAEAGYDTLFAVGCGALTLILAHQRRNPRIAYAALADCGVGLVLALIWAGSPTGFFPGALMAYGGVLCAVAFFLLDRERGEQQPATNREDAKAHPAAWARVMGIGGQGAAMAGAAWQVSVLAPQAHFAVPAWSLMMLAWAALYWQIGRRWQSAGWRRLAPLPLVAGYAAYFVWRTAWPMSVPDSLFADILWTIGGALAAWAYGRVARRERLPLDASLGAAIGAGAWLHTLYFPLHLRPEWLALAFLPLLALVGILALQQAETEFENIGQAALHTLLAISAPVLLLSAGAADGLTRWPWRAVAPLLTTLTLASYGLLFAVWTLWRRTKEAAAFGVTTLTLAYLHALLTHTAAFTHDPATMLSWPKFAFYAVQSGLFWMVLGWRARRRDALRQLAPPLLVTAGGVSLFSLIVALLAVETTGEGQWSVLTLGWGGVIWYGLWAMALGEICLHVGTWSLLIGWGLIVHNWVTQNPAWTELGLLDVYALPVGAYLLGIGHLSARRQRRETARLFWWGGLLLLLTPTFLTYLNHGAGWHTLLLIFECLGAIVWGVGQRIRAFVCAGLGFITAFGVVALANVLPDVWGTLASLLIGVGLFVAGFYALTHRDAVRRWAGAFEARWQAWSAWR